MPDKEASMEPKQEGRWELRDGIWFAIKGTEGPLYNSAWMREEVNDLEARLAAAEQQAQTLREQEVYWRRRVHSLRAEAQTLRTALLEYGVHKTRCSRLYDYSGNNNPHCTCGLDAALNQSAGASDE
jgi:uncharacterized protein YacL (UPF0231 family)